MVEHDVSFVFSSDYEKMVVEMRAEHADTINELEKTRNLLIIQYKLNKDYAQEVQSVTAKMEEERAEYEEKLEEFAQLLDIRAMRIRVGSDTGCSLHLKEMLLQLTRFCAWISLFAEVLVVVACRNWRLS